MPQIRSIYRYPIKGLSPEPLPRVKLAPRQTIPGDRLYAIENGPSGFNPDAPAYLPKTQFLMLMRNERLAALHTAFDDDTHTLTVDLPVRARAAPRQSAATCAPPKAARPSKKSSPPIAPTSCAARQESCTPTGTPFPTSPAR